MSAPGIALALGIALQPAISVAADTADQIAECHFASDDRLLQEPAWFGLYWKQTRVGYYHGYAHQIDPHRYELVYEISLSFDDRKTVIRESRMYSVSAPHRLLSAILERGDERLVVRNESGRLQVQSGGQTLHWDQQAAWTICDEEVVAIERFLAGSVRPGDRFETQYFDVRALQTAIMRHQVQSIETRTVQGTEHQFQTLLTHSEQQDSSSRILQRFRDGYAITLNLGQLQARLETREQALSAPGNIGQLEILSIPIDEVLDPNGLTTIRSLRVRVSIDDPLLNIRDAIQDGVMQRVDYLDERSAVVTVGARPDQAPSDQDISQYLAANFTYPADHPRIRQIAASIRRQLPDTASETELARAILFHTADTIEYELIGTASVLEVLDSKRGDCTEYAQMFIALARAAGLPAREVTGFIYTGSARQGAFGGHAWVEVFSDGRWLSMDPTGRQVQADNSHLQFRNFMASGLTLAIETVQTEAEPTPGR